MVVATGVPVISPVVVLSVPPVELLRSPIATEARPPMPVKFERPIVVELRVEAMLRAPKAEEQELEAMFS